MTPIPKFPIIDMHGDLLSYLAFYQGAHAYRADEIGCSISFLRKGRVNLQVMAIYSALREGSTKYAYEQSLAFKKLSLDPNVKAVRQFSDLEEVIGSERVGIVSSIENASGLCEESGPLDKTFENLELIIDNTGLPLYISLTHEEVNRFGGGNFSKEGLKPDGKVLLEYLHRKKIAVDLSHSSDSLAHDILDFINCKNLDIQIVASHSNFRSIWKHRRNLPDDLVQEIVKQKGLIGINFFREFVHGDSATFLQKHISYGFDSGAEDSICFGADFFCALYASNPELKPNYFPPHNNAAKYPDIIDKLRRDGISEERLKKLSYLNVKKFIQRMWDE